MNGLLNLSTNGNIDAYTIESSNALYFKGLTSNIQAQLNSLSGLINLNSSSTNTIINYNYSSLSGAIYTINNNYNLQNTIILSVSGAIYNIIQQVNVNNSIINYYSIYLLSLSGNIQNNYNNISNTINNNYNFQNIYLSSISGLLNTYNLNQTFINNSTNNIISNQNIYLSSLSGNIQAVYNFFNNSINSINNNQNNIIVITSLLSGLINTNFLNQNFINNSQNTINNSQTIYLNSLSGSFYYNINNVNNSINSINNFNSLNINSLSGIVYNNLVNQGIINNNFSNSISSIINNKYILTQPFYLPAYNQYISLLDILRIQNTTDYIQNQLNNISTAVSKVAGNSVGVSSSNGASSIGSIVNGVFTAASGAATIAGFYIMMQSITALRLEMTGLQL